MSPDVAVRRILGIFGMLYDPTATSHVRKMQEAVAVLTGKEEPQPVAPGGDMPAPWPGMGVEVRLYGRGVAILTVDYDGGHFVPLARCNPESAETIPAFLRADDIDAIYDGRREIWRRA